MFTMHGQLGLKTPRFRQIMSLPARVIENRPHLIGGNIDSFQQVGMMQE